MTATTMTYCGIDDDEFGGMTQIGGIIKDAWVFGILPETETCAGWSQGQLQVIREQTQAAWDEHGGLVSGLPPDLRERHRMIHDRAIAKARELGWPPDLDDDD